MSATDLTTDSRISPTSDDWSDVADVSGHAAAWLTANALLTADIRCSFDAPLEVDVLQETMTTMPRDIATLINAQQGWLREILMRSGTTPLVHATCFAPPNTCAQHPWLQQLGNKPLGAMLAQLHGVQRSNMQFSTTQATDPARYEWSRRSVFDLQGAPLVLIEHLSSELLARPRVTQHG